MVSSAYTEYDDATLLTYIAVDDTRAFDEVYNRYLNVLLGYAYNRTSGKEEAKEIVQDVFLSLWERRTKTHITSLRSYLYTAVKFKIIAAMRNEKVRTAYAEKFYTARHDLHDNSNEQYQNLNDIDAVIDKSLEELPEKYRMVFNLSRRQHLPIAEVAKRMNITKHSAETYITTVLKHLRGSLGEFMILVWWLVD